MTSSPGRADMDTQQLFKSLRGRGVSFFTGVPDSALKSLSSLLLQQCTPHEHIIAANEGNAVGLAMGHYLATGMPAVVYMQNSGLGNAINPLVSLADPEVYSIPMLLMIGWRGKPDQHDEPQHIKQGRITTTLLETLEIPYRIAKQGDDPESLLAELWPVMLEGHRPVALVIEKDALSPVRSECSAKPQALDASPTPFVREQVISQLLDYAAEADCFIATTGKTGRELFELRVQRGEPQHDFLTVGGMGHTASLALGVALSTQKRIICLDGDGSVLMHMGALGILGTHQPRQFLHVLLNNECHESVGGQPTIAGSLDFQAIAKACGYAGYAKAVCSASLEKAWQTLSTRSGVTMLEVLLWKGSRADLGRPTTTPTQNKRAFMEHTQS